MDLASRSGASTYHPPGSTTHATTYSTSVVWGRVKTVCFTSSTLTSRLAISDASCNISKIIGHSSFNHLLISVPLT